MRTAIQSLVRFISATDNDEERGEIRGYAVENADDLADAFGVKQAAFLAGIARESDDAQLARRLFTEAKRAGREDRTAPSAERLRVAQVSADALGRSATWEGDRATLDVRSLLTSVLTKPGDELVLVSEAFTVSIPKARLFELARLRRSDLSAYVDAIGLHVRWPTGALNFVSVKPGPKALAIVVVHLCSRAVSAA